ncbi:hypothetical protein BDK51DRAFT_26623 [Blyttiomyces helicus]|uniref:UBA domain-containing protein n=1 Tax=Blyttiomyces helicus TaxID=388810 RepID=A0A4P9WKC5_9FUNG|nr:hypothetical protein BDK51DRAFT_26623 [Blyttiomyces helicus]|eukprot:RKO93264.1 hypothetical protein BDK51DRAFT_26623 [Blyttiomyces helicus]
MDDGYYDEDDYYEEEEEQYDEEEAPSVADVRAVIGSGFSDAQISAALARFNNDFDRAVDALLESGPQPTAPPGLSAPPGLAAPPGLSKQKSVVGTQARVPDTDIHFPSSSGLQNQPRILSTLEAASSLLGGTDSTGVAPSAGVPALATGTSPTPSRIGPLVAPSAPVAPFLLASRVAKSPEANATSDPSRTVSQGLAILPASQETGSLYWVLEPEDWEASLPPGSEVLELGDSGASDLRDSEAWGPWDSRVSHPGDLPAALDPEDSEAPHPEDSEASHPEDSEASHPGDSEASLQGDSEVLDPG